MKKRTLMVILLFLVALVVSGCTEYPLLYSSPKSIANSGGEVETPELLKITGPGPYMCTEGKTCRSNDGTEYSVPCYRDPSGNGCIQPPCNSGDWWVSNYCHYIPINPELASEVSNP